VLRVPVALVAVSFIVVAGCGGSGTQKATNPLKNVSAKARDAVTAAENVDASKFPKPSGDETIEQFSSQFQTPADAPQALAGTSVYRTPGGRLAFGLLDSQQRFNYGASVVYIAPYQGGKVLGPFPAPADVLLTDPKFRSQQAATDTSPFAAIYEAHVPFKKPGVYKVLVVSDIGGQRIAAGMNAQVVTPAKDRIPDVGDMAPKVQTDTRATVHGNLDLLDTRSPKAPELTSTSLADVLGKKPVAVLFATPQLCQSRVCGPVTDEMLQIRAETGNKMTFIHQEPYLNNNIQKGFRPQVQRYGLQSEPWLFTIDRHGRIAARLEGSIGINAFRAAVKAALKP
jgi:hypothetical protein